MPPLALFLTWRTYGTWLPGDERGWVDEQRNAYGERRHAPDPRIEGAARGLMLSKAVVFTEQERNVLDSAIRTSCGVLGFSLLALNVRTNHVHAVLTAEGREPSRTLNTLKSHATRILREQGMRSADDRIWARGGSMRWLMTDDAVSAAVDYVLNRQ